jgi:5-methylcytosine-specific restriction endonuclease McrA
MPRKDPAARQAYEQGRRQRKAEQMRARRAANPEKFRAQARARRATNPQKFREAEKRRSPRRKASRRIYNKNYREQNLAEVLAYLAQWRNANREKIAAFGKRRYEAKREQILAQIAVYRQQNPEKIRARNALRRARKKNAPINDLTHAQWCEIQEAQKHRCYYCGKRRKGHLTQDHLTPLSKHGSHTVQNVIAACGSCNSRKWKNPPPIPVQPFLLTVTPARKPKAL